MQYCGFTQNTPYTTKHYTTLLYWFDYLPKVIHVATAALHLAFAGGAGGEPARVRAALGAG